MVTRAPGRPTCNFVNYTKISKYFYLRVRSSQYVVYLTLRHYGMAYLYSNYRRTNILSPGRGPGGGGPAAPAWVKAVRGQILEVAMPYALMFEGTGGGGREGVREFTISK